jgi:hypothetical protein
LEGSFRRRFATDSDDAGHRRAARPPIWPHRSASVPEGARWAYLCSGRHEHDPRGTNRQSNTHNSHCLEAREVRYPWHPWCGRRVVVYEALSKQGRRVFYCGSEEGPVVRHLEIPQWMFDPEACCRMPLAGAPIVGCDALLDLKELLRSVPRQQRDIVLRTQHHPLGGADAKITEPTEGHPARTVSGVAEGPLEARIASRDPREDDPTAGTSAKRARYQNSRLPSQKGGVG